jgi:hypothetical protein
LGDTVPFDVLLWTEKAGLKSGGEGVGKTARPDVSCCLVTTSGQLIKRKQHLPQREYKRETNTFALHCKDKIPKIRNKYSQKRNCARPQSQFPHSCVCERFIYSHGSVCLFCCRKLCGPILGIYKNRSQTHERWKLGLRPRNSFSGNT